MESPLSCCLCRSAYFTIDLFICCCCCCCLLLLWLYLLQLHLQLPFAAALGVPNNMSNKSTQTQKITHTHTHTELRFGGVGGRRGDSKRLPRAKKNIDNYYSPIGIRPAIAIAVAIESTRIRRVNGWTECARSGAETRPAS